MDSQEPTSLSSSSNASSDNTENVIETNVVNSVTKINYNTSSTSSSNSSLSASSEYEDEGFGIVDEENPVFVEETLENAYEGGDNGSDEIDDGVENVAESSVSEGGRVERDVRLVENDSSLSSVVEAVPVDMPAPNRAIITNTEEEEEDDDDDDDVLLVGGSDETNRIVEAPESDSVVGNVMKLTAEGDSVVEEVDVDLPLGGVAGVAVVTKMEEDRDDVAMIDGSESSEKMDRALENVVDKEVVGVTDGKFAPLDVEASVAKNPEAEIQKGVDYEAKEVVSVMQTADESKHIDEDAISGSEVDVVDEKIESLNSKSSVAASNAISSDGVNIGIADQGDTEMIEANGGKLTTLGDYVGEAGQVGLPAPEVALITTMEEDSDEDVLLVGGPDETSGVVDAPHEPVDSNGMKRNADVDSVVEALDVDLPGVVGVSVEDGGAVSGSSEKDHVLEDVMYKKVIGVTEGKISPLDVETSDGDDLGKNEKNLEAEIQKGVVHEAEEIGSVVTGDADFVADDKFPEKIDAGEDGDMDSLTSGEDTDSMIFKSSEAAKQFMEELERRSGGGSHSGGESSQDRSQMIDGRIATDSDEEDEEEHGKELFGSSAMAALLRAASDGGSRGGNITFSSQDVSRLFTVERPAGLGSSLQSMRPSPTSNHSKIFSSSRLVSGGETDSDLSEEERVKLEKLQSIRVKFLRLIQRLGLSTETSVAAQVLYRLALIAGRHTSQSFSLEAAKRKAIELEAEKRDDLDFSLNILVIGKSGVGKSATINSMFGEKKSVINAFQPATGAVKEISGTLNGVKIRVFDTPGLKSSIMDQRHNRSILSSAKKMTKKKPIDLVLYIDRLDGQTRDLNDLPLLRTITGSLGSSIWRNAIITLTHSASAPPEGSSGSPLSYDFFVNQRSHVIQQGIGQAVGDMHLMNPVSLVENHPLCRKNRDGQQVLPNGQTWRPQLLMLCYSMKILSEVNSLLKAQYPNDNGKRFGFRFRLPPLPYMLSSMLQSRPHPKLSSDDGADSDLDLADLPDSDQEDDDEDYDQLPPFKPLKNSQLSKLSKEQRNAYFDEYDYRVKLLKKKQWKDELTRIREMKKGKDYYPSMEEEDDAGAPAPVAVPLPDMVLPPSFDSDNPAYRFRFLEPTSQFLARPVLDTHGWDHDCGYDGVNIEQNLAIATRFPAAVSAQITKDKKDFSFNLDSSVSTKHGENGSSMAGFDIQPIGKQLAYIIRGETKFKNLKKNKTAAGISVTFLGENVVTGFKLEDQIGLGKQYSITGSAGTVRFQNESAYGANIEVQRRELDYPIGQVQSTIGISIVKWKGDLALGFNSLAQFSAGRNSKVAVRAGINNKMSGQITIKTSSSEHLSLAFTAIIPCVIAACNKLWPAAGENDSTY